MIKYLIPLAGLLVLFVSISLVTAQQDGEKSDLETSSFLFRPVYIRYGGWPAQNGWGHVQHTLDSSYGHGWGSWKLSGEKKKGKKKKGSKKSNKKANKKEKKKGNNGGWIASGYTGEIIGNGGYGAYNGE